MIGSKTNCSACCASSTLVARRTPSDLPTWRRAAFAEVRQWVKSPPAPRAMLLSGARQTGKTTLLLQAIESLLAEGVPPGQILYGPLTTHY